MSEEAKVLENLYRWPEKWMMLDEDLDYGKQLSTSSEISVALYQQ